MIASQKTHFILNKPFHSLLSLIKSLAFTLRGMTSVNWEINPGIFFVLFINSSQFSCMTFRFNISNIQVNKNEDKCIISVTRTLLLIHQDF